MLDSPLKDGEQELQKVVNDCKWFTDKLCVPIWTKVQTVGIEYTPIKQKISSVVVGCDFHLYEKKKLTTVNETSGETEKYVLKNS